ncbi:MAG: hypothetical protein AAF915_21355 [Cyanobacteria bacterium P01_D01_bin.50]
MNKQIESKLSTVIHQKKLYAPVLSSVRVSGTHDIADSTADLLPSPWVSTRSIYRKREIVS